MSLPKISISRPIFITCITIAIIVVGWASFKSMSVDLFPDVSVPVVSVQTVYPGAGPSEIETLVSRPIEEEVSTIAGIKRLTSKSLEGVSQVIVEFNSTVDSKDAEQQVRDKVNIAKAKLPDEVEDSVIKKFDPSDTPILMLSLTAKDMGDAQLFDIADQYIKPRLEQVSNVGAIEIFGGREREIHVILDRNKLRPREISVSQVAGQVGASGENIPSGKVEQGGKELVFRGLGEFKTVSEIGDTLVNLYGNEVPTRVADLGKVVDTLEDEKSRAYVNGQKAIFLQVYRQSGSNTVKVADDVLKQMEKLKPELEKMQGAPQVQLVTNASTKIKNNIYDVNETIIIGIILTVITVFFFLGSARSTLITAFSLPISLIGSFMVMKLAGFSINIVSMLALTLAVGLLIDDAIVVIENIYRRMELGEDSLTAAEKGTSEIQMAVMAITLVVIAVFVPVGTMSGTIGQFLKQFGMTVVFSMAISWFVAMTIIPMLTAYFGGEGHSTHKPVSNSLYDKTLGRMVRGFDRFQASLETVFEKFLRVTLNHPLKTIGATFLVFVLSIYTVTKVPGAFITDDDAGEFTVTLEMSPGTSLNGMNKVGDEVDKIIRANSEVDYTTMIIGTQYGESNKASYYVRLKKERGGLTTEQFRDKVRQQLTPFAATANPVVKKYDASGGMGAQPFTLNLVSADPEALNASAEKLMAVLKTDPRLKDLNSNYRPGKPEMQVILKPGAARQYGVNTSTMGGELRAQIEGYTPAKFREKGREYNVRVRLLPEQRDLKENFNAVYVPNVNRKLVRLSDIAKGDETTGPASIERQDRGRYIQITAGLAPGAGLSDVVNDAVKAMTAGESALPPSVRYAFAGDAENMQELVTSTVLALGFAILFIYLILASLYESFITPITIMIAMPLALCGGFLGLYLMNETITIFAIFGLFMLIGVAGKNGILLVDYTRQLMAEGKSRADALVEAGKTRLRPILMTSFALIAGTIPVAIGLNEASKSRTAMGVVIIGGMITSTILTLIVVPAVFTYVDRFRLWANDLGARFTSHKKEHKDRHVEVKISNDKKENEMELAETEA
ncbi:efflux RND transporter permease subunit [Bdellovibrio reynosensis]|uniref:Efflux RND transporter permease subunit n=1 Tax=Bdellovibrio reynosensis TaxID=2835041 RepID=A0ABY4CG29_9BACT|nr:efflux RND transporter permease subunit [Bdellovibrio reynosensis]UOF01165.1 efflux RND transporter permease subunit [Bdellovibrio reynosensis]